MPSSPPQQEEAKVTSETVVVELEREGAEQIAIEVGAIRPSEAKTAAKDHPQRYADAYKKACDDLRAALASDSQGEEMDTPDEHGVTAIDRAIVEDMAEQGGDGDWPEILAARQRPGDRPLLDSTGKAPPGWKRIETRRYVPASTQPSLSAEDREQLEALANRIASDIEEEWPHAEEMRGYVRFLRHLASAPPEVSGEEGGALRDFWPPVDVHAKRPSTERWTGPANIAWCPEHGLHGARDTCFECGKPVEQIELIPTAELRGASPPEPSVQEEGRRWKIESSEGDEGFVVGPDFTGELEVMPVQEHEATVGRLNNAHLGVLEITTEHQARANDLQARLEKMEAEKERVALSALRERDTRIKAEAALEEAAKEFERQANELLARRDSCPPMSRRRMVLERAAGAHCQDAQHLREKQAALKGGGADGDH